jgi:hypothetical protein
MIVLRILNANATLILVELFNGKAADKDQLGT